MRFETKNLVDESDSAAVQFALVAQGRRLGVARAEAEAIKRMVAELEMSRTDVVDALKVALERLHGDELQKVSINRLREHPVDSGRYIASYVFRDFRDVSMGFVWYDVSQGVTGPDNVPALVRNKLRYDVHAQLVKGNAAAEEILKVLL